jgi:hypothetical protein
MPMELGAIQRRNNNGRPSGSNNNKPRSYADAANPNRRTRLDNAERQRCIQLGLCFFCRKAGHQLNECADKKKADAAARQAVAAVQPATVAAAAN